MEAWRNIQDEIEELERLQLISLTWIKRWVMLLLTTIAFFIYLWNTMFSEVNGYNHYPAALAPDGVGMSYGTGREKLHYTSEQEARKNQLREINLVMFACGNDNTQLQQENNCQPATEALITMKSATVSSNRVIHFHIFTDDSQYHCFIKELDKWPNDVRHRVSFKFHAATSSEATLFSHFSKKLPSACQLSYLFIPHLLKDLNQVIYVKSGGLFVHSLDVLWLTLTQFSEHHVIAAPLSSSESMCKLESSKIDHVYDASVILMDTYRLRTNLFDVPKVLKHGESNPSVSLPLRTTEHKSEKITWSPTMLLSFFEVFTDVIQVPEHDILNLIAFFNPVRFMELPSCWNIHLNVEHNMLTAFAPQLSGNICQTVNLVFLQEQFDCHSFFCQHLAAIKKKIFFADFQLLHKLRKTYIPNIFSGVCFYIALEKQCVTCRNASDFFLPLVLAQFN